MRAIATDGWNSFWHFFFGFAAWYIPLIIPLFVIYQLIDPYEKNILIDLSEFFIGFLIAFGFYISNKIEFRA